MAREWEQGIDERDGRREAKRPRRRKMENECESEGERRHSRERVVKPPGLPRARLIFSSNNATTGCSDRFFLRLRTHAHGRLSLGPSD